MEVKELAGQVLSAMQKHIKATFDPLLKRIDALEKNVSGLISGDKDYEKIFNDLSQPQREMLESAHERVKSAFLKISDIEQSLKRLEQCHPKDGKDGVDGKDADHEKVFAFVKDVVASLPKAKDGVDGKDGKDAVVVDIEEVARKAALLIPVPKDGKDGSIGTQGEKGEDGLSGKDGRDGIDGKDGAQGIAGDRGIDGKNGSDGLNGKDVTQEMVEIALSKMLPSLIEKSIERATSGIAEKAAGLIPKPVDGRDGRDGVAGAVGERGVDGKSVDMEVVIEKIEQYVGKSVSALPVPKDGVDGQNGINGKDGANGVDGKDAIPVDKSEVAKEILSMIPVPKDGKDGLDGKSVTVEEVLPTIEGAVAKWEVDFERRAADVLQRAVDKIPTPKPGEDGKDGFSIDDIDLKAIDGGRTVVMSLKSGDRVVERQVTLAVPIYREVYKFKEQYKAGDSVTYAGSLWIALKDTEATPKTNDDWKMAVKRGVDGKNV